MLDLIVVMITTLLGVPGIVEVFDLGMGPLNGVDMLILKNMGVFGTVIDAMEFSGCAADTNKLFSAFHFFLSYGPY